MTEIPLRTLEPARTVSATDMVFEELYKRVMSLELPPGSKISETEVARQMGVSRQPVRDAFYRLSQLGFIRIRPQRATTVTKISENSVLQARFIRAAIEIQVVRDTVEALTPETLAELEAMVEVQAEAVAAGDKLRFHVLDDEFHHRMCEISGHGYVWTLIRDTKAHMDRVRYLSLSFGAESALNDHRDLLTALRARDADAAAGHMRRHLSRIRGIMAQIRADHADYFEDPET